MEKRLEFSEDNVKGFPFFKAEGYRGRIPKRMTGFPPNDVSLKDIC